mgnify:CR=1 FL=1
MPVVVLALSSSLFYGVSDFVGGLAARRMPVVAMTAVIYAVSAVVLLGACVLVPMEVSAAAVSSGVAAGAFAVVGFLAFYGALVTGAMSLLSPIVAATQAAVPVLADVVLLGHQPSPIGWVGIAVALCGGLLLGLPDAGPGALRIKPRVLALGLVAGVTLGVSTVCLDAAPADSGVLPVTFDVLTGLTVLVSILVLARVSTTMRRWAGSLDVANGHDDGSERPSTPRQGLRSALLLAASAGLLLGVGNVFLMLGLHAGSLAVVAVLMGLYPLATVLLARVVLGERLARVQVVGVVAALAACVLLGLA